MNPTIWEWPQYAFLVFAVLGVCGGFVRIGSGKVGDGIISIIAAGITQYLLFMGGFYV